MSYIGKEPADSFISFAKQDFSTSATTSYTLDNAVTNENELALFINFVRQEPTTAYTASGTTLTLTSATTSSDDMYCVYLGQAKQTVNAPDGSVGSSQVASTIITGQTAETSIATDDLILLSDTSASGALKKMTRANFVTGLGLAECSFRAYQSSSQGISNVTATQVTLDTEDWDTDNAFASSTFTCPSDKAGKYIVVGAVRADPSWATTNQFNVMIYRNGASNTGGFSSQNIVASKGNSMINVSIVNMSAGDTLKLYLYHDEGGSESLQPGQESTYFAGTRITE